MNIARIRSKQGTKSVLTYWYKRHRYRVRLPGVNLAGDEEKRQAIAAVTEIHRMVDEAARPDLPFREFAPIYLKHLGVKQRIAAYRNESALRCHLTPWFGALTLRSIRLEHGIAYIEHRRKEGAAEGTIERECAVLSALLNSAVDYEYLDRNRLKKLPSPQYQKRKRVATPEELKALAETVSQATHPNGKEARRQVILLTAIALNTGVREAKIVEMDYGNLKKQDDGWWWYPPAGSRIKGVPEMVPLNRIAVEAIKAAGPWSLQGRVFARWKDANSFKHLWLRMLELAKITDLHFHDLRHTFATWLQDLDVPYEIRQILLGHRVKGTTFDYSHGGKSALRRAVTLLEGATCGTSKTAPRKTRRANSLEDMVPRDRIELSTPAFSGLCSAN